MGMYGLTNFQMEIPNNTGHQFRVTKLLFLEFLSTNSWVIHIKFFILLDLHLNYKCSSVGGSLLL